MFDEISINSILAGLSGTHVLGMHYAKLNHDGQECVMVERRPFKLSCKSEFDAGSVTMGTGK